MYSTNKHSDVWGHGGAGVRVTLDTMEGEIGGVEYDDIPCMSASASVEWSDTHGKSLGLDRDWNYLGNDRLFATVTETPDGPSCSGDGCIGAARVDIGSTSVTRFLHPTWDSLNPEPPDLVAKAPDVTLLQKGDTGGVHQWNVITGGDQYDTTGLAHGSQMDWLDGNYYVATITEFQGDCVAGTNTGRLVLLEQDHEGVLAEDDLSRDTSDTGVEVDNKPEGVDAVPIDTSRSNTMCKTGGVLYADFVVYVADYCNDRIHVFTVDSTSPTKHVAEKGVVSIHGTDPESNCNPSSVRYDSTQDVVVVVCQSRGTILNVDVDNEDQCDLTFNESTEESLTYADAAPTCDGPQAQSECEDVCTPHNIDYDLTCHPGWLFVALTGKRQLTAVRADNYAAQSVIFRAAAATFKPMDLVIVGAE